MEILLNYADTIFPFMIFMLSLICVRRVRENYRLLRIYLLLTTIIMGFSNYLADHGIYNLYLYHFYSLSEVLLIIPLISSFITREKKVLSISLLLYTVFWIIDVLYFETFREFNSISSSVAALLISAFCFRYFLYIADNDEVFSFQKNPSFWIVSGFLLYSFGAIAVIGGYKYVEEWSRDSLIMWQIFLTVNILKYFIISIGVLCCYRRDFRFGG